MNTSDDQSEMVLSDDREAAVTRGTEATAIHELGHRMEFEVPGLNGMERRFRQRRAAGEPLTIIHAGTKETGYLDDFVTHYTGRDYDGRGDSGDSLGGLFGSRPEDQYRNDPGFSYATEVFTTGVESLFGGRLGGQVGAYPAKKSDLEMRGLILGAMASAGVVKYERS